MDQGALEISLRTNSTWTPRNHIPSREKVFEERLSLIDKWYSGWSKEKRRMFLEHMLMKCTLDQLVLIDSYVHPQLPEPPADFTRLLPRYLSLKIFTFLDPRSLCRATQVCWYWHYLTEENCIWKPKCLRFGWTLPSPPLPTDMGTWKRHYLSCVRNLHWVPPPPTTKGKTEEIVMTNEETNEGRNLPLSVITMGGRRKKPTSRTSKQYKRREGTFVFSRNDSMLQDKPAWRHPNRFPKNLEQSTILTTSWVTSKHTRHKKCHRSLSTGSIHHILSANTSLDDIKEDKQVYLQDEESLIDSKLPQHVTFPRRSLSNNNSNLPDRKNVGHINRSEMYNSLLKRSATSQDVVTVAKADNTQHTLINKPPLYDEQSFPNDTNNTTVQLNTNPWPMKLDYDSTESDT